MGLAIDIIEYGIKSQCVCVYFNNSFNICIFQLQSLCQMQVISDVGHNQCKIYAVREAVMF